MIEGANSHVDGPNFSELSSGLQTGSTTVQTSSAPLTIEVRQSNEDNAVKAVPTKNEPTSVPRIPPIVPPQSNKVTVGGVDQAARKKLNRTIDLLNYPDTVEILASEDAGCVRFIWIFILLGLVLLSAVQITYLVYQFINEETGTSIRYEKIEPDFVKNNFQMKICFKDPPIDVFETAVMTKFPDSVKRNETQKLIITLAVLNQMGIASFGETIAAFEEQFKNRVGREPSHMDYKQQAEEFKTILKSSSTNMREIVDDVTLRLIDQYIHIDGESLLMQGLGGVGRELCIRRPTTDFTLKPSYLVVHEEFPIRNGKLPLLNDSKFTFYGGQLEEYLSAAHFVPMSKSMAYYNVEMIRYVYQNRKNAPCKSSDDFLFPKGFAQSVCEKECWNRAHAETFNCSKINTNRTPFGLTDEHGAKEPCGFPTVLGYSATEIEAVWNNYIKAYEKCLDKAKCETEQYCTEYEITSKLIDPTPVKQYCYSDVDQTSLNTKKCTNLFYMFVFSDRIQVIEEYFLHSIVSVLSDSGGQIGLWIGFSVLELCKVLIHWIIKLKGRKRMRQQITTHLAKSEKLRGSSKQKDAEAADALIKGKNDVATKMALQNVGLGMLVKGLDQMSTETVVNLLAKQNVPLEQENQGNQPATQSYLATSAPSSVQYEHMPKYIYNK